MTPLLNIPRPIIKSEQVLVGALVAIFLICAPLGHASEKAAPAKAPVTAPVAAASNVCGVLEDFGGGAQVLDATRSNLLDTDVRTALPCGAWVSTEDGWARIIHRDGYRISVGSHSFVELLGRSDDQDQLVLYRGQIRVQADAGTGTGEVRVVSPHARARLKGAQAIVVYSQSEQETQVISLKNTTVFENRFESSSRVKIKAGEASTLSFKAMRVTPSIPQAVSTVSLRQKLADLRLDDRAKGEAIQAARSRQNRHFASLLAEDENHEEPARQPAGLEFSKDKAPARKTVAAKASDYRRHPPKEDDVHGKDEWTRRLIGGVQDGEKILHPEKFYGRPSEVRLSVEDVDASRKPAKTAAAGQGEESEKERLLRELSQIRVD